MLNKNLQNLIDYLLAKQQLYIINQPVSPYLEMTEIADRVYQNQTLSQPILFTNTGTSFPVLMNIFARPELLHDYLSFEKVLPLMNELPFLIKPKINNTTIAFLRRLLKTRPKRVNRAPCQAVQRPDLTFDDFPILTCWPKDGGRYITLPLVHTIDPETGEHNMGMYRMQIFDARTAGMHWHVNKGGHLHYEKWKKLGKRMPVTITLGGPPALIYAATAPLPHGISEYMFAGFLLNKRIPIVQSTTNPIWIPAESEIVFEGYVDPLEPPRLEGPFGDHTGFYSVPDYYPVFHLEHITHRKNAVYPATIVGIPPKEDELLGKATVELFTPLIKLLHPELHQLFLPPEGGFHNMAIASIHNHYHGATEKFIHAIWSMGMLSLTKVILVVEDDVNITNTDAILKAIDQHVSIPQDFIFSRGSLDVLDHAASQFAYGGKLAIDATARFKTQKTFNLHTPEIFFPHSWLSARIALVYHENPLEVLSWIEQHKKALADKIIIVMETPWQHFPKNLQLWYALAAVDPLRDFTINPSEPFVFIDATSINKKASPHQAPWPDMVFMDSQIINLVDQRWNEYGFPFFMPSPSKLFHGYFTQ